MNSRKGYTLRSKTHFKCFSMTRFGVSTGVPMGSTIRSSIYNNHKMDISAYYYA